MNNLNEVVVLEPYNPLDKKRIGEQIAAALLAQPIHPLPPEKFIGAGVYALYYTGDFPSYALLSAANKNGQYHLPIYVGKAVPDGTRKGGRNSSENQGAVLYRRLNEHAKSISAVKNLKLEDFCCRFLAVDDIWIVFTETILIEKFLPVWNCLLEGFGNHVPGKGRKSMITPAWDWYHPGRAWAEHLKPCSKTVAQFDAEIRGYLKNIVDVTCPENFLRLSP